MKFDPTQHYCGSKATHPKRKHGWKTTWHGPFHNRQTARQWCRNHWHLHTGGVCIRLPDGTIEDFKPTSY